MLATHASHDLGIAHGAYARCAKYAGLLRLHDPDPYYVKYLFLQYLRAADAAIGEIFADADACFGLFVQNGPATRDSFAACLKRRRAARRSRTDTDDALAAKFLAWYDDMYESQWHHPPGSYPHVMRCARDEARLTLRAPDVRIMMAASDAHPGDPVCEVDAPGLTANGRIKSRAILDEQVRIRTPILLEMINHKRRLCGEPGTRAGRIRASAFVIIRENGPGGARMTADIPHAALVYAGTIKRMRAESALYMRDMLSRWARESDITGRGRISGAARPS